MSKLAQRSTAQRTLFDHDDVDGVLHGSFYAPSAPLTPSPPPRAKRLTPADRRAHYKVICISVYNEDLEHLDDMVRALKSRGYTKASRSALIRHALSVVDLDRVPRGI